MTAIAYVDSSALVKLLVDESGSAGMTRWYVEAERVLSSRIGIIETRRAVARRSGNPDPGLVDRILQSVEVFELDADIGRTAATVGPPGLRTLDAIHIATALAIPGVDAFVTYDDRLATAARALGLPVVAPA
jgi:predicted nucleic acid-binding protein